MDGEILGSEEAFSESVVVTLFRQVGKLGRHGELRETPQQKAVGAALPWLAGGSLGCPWLWDEEGMSALG